MLVCNPACTHAQFEDAAREAADELTQPRPEGEEDQVEDIQVMLRSDANPVQIRQLRVSQTYCSMYM